MPSGLYLSLFRGLSSKVGRWVSRDPLPERGLTVNQYSYVRNNPVNLIDPLGLEDYGFDHPDEFVDCCSKNCAAARNDCRWNCYNYGIPTEPSPSSTPSPTPTPTPDPSRPSG